ncbi:TRAP transporter substrate-binding protein [Propionivibrio sp.]|uniref:TRAP transporter substrate-binding protein n=1 Tax=Propionivibrio sp. TaxID=2212460 RepID=UPI00272ED8EA|nr:TRAP transporter substrate-binding protein [Propionivibrio sp.]
MKGFASLKLAAVVAGVFAVGMAQAQVNERTFRIAINGAPGHPTVVGAEKWAELINKKSGGKMTLKVFPSTLGGDVQVLSAVQGGTIDFASMNSGILQGIQKEFAIFDLPFMFGSGPEADKVLDGPFGKKLADLLPSKNLYNLAYWELGFRNVTNSKRPIAKASDLEGIKLRVIQSPIYIDTFTALGTNPVPMNFSEVYTALESKIIDGQENPFSVIETSRFNEVQKYLGITNHMYNPQSVIASKKKWDALTKDEQEILISTVAEATLWQRQNARAMAGKSLENLKKTMEVSELPPEEIAKIREKLKPVIEKYSVNVGAELVKELQAELDKVRK